MKYNKNGGFLTFLVMIGILVIFSGCIKEPPQPTIPPIPTASPTPTSTLTATPTPTPTSTPTITVTSTQAFIFVSPEEGQTFTAGAILYKSDVHGTHKLPSNTHVWLLLSDVYGNYCLQNPPVRFINDGTWTATNIRLGQDIDQILAVKVTEEGDKEFQKKVQNQEWGAFQQLPAGSEVIATINIKVLSTPTEPILITAPSDRASVPERPFVEGTVNDSNAEVWVIVHPIEVSQYWVQPPVTVNRDGTWRVMIYIGRPGNVDVGEQFEIMAVANPKVKLNEGDQLSRWPEAQWKSEVILVARR